jgi:hypothetical protein
LRAGVKESSSYGFSMGWDAAGGWYGNCLLLAWRLYMIGRKSLLTIALVALILSVVGPSNLRADIVNGDFELGNVGFTSGYVYVPAPVQPLTGPGGMWAEGTYTVDTNPKAYHDLWTAFADHTTTGPGNMLIANGSPTAGINVWVGGNGVPLSAGTYTFSAWVASVYPDNPAQINFSVGSTSIGTITASGTAGLWTEFSGNFTVGGGSPAFASVDINTLRSGNDFALDDIHITQVPDGGTTVLLLGLALAAGSFLRRRLS